jgi:hypothetical protein
MRTLLGARLPSPHLTGNDVQGVPSDRTRAFLQSKAAALRQHQEHQEARRSAALVTERHKMQGQLQRLSRVRSRTDIQNLQRADLLHKLDAMEAAQSGDEIPL